MVEEYANLFGTVAQVSFEFAGLLFIALTISEQRRIRWFDQKNRIFSGLCFLMVMWPGFIALFGLIPEMPLNYLSIVSALFYATTLVIWWRTVRISKKEIRAERSRWEWLQKIRDIKGEVLIACVVWVISIFLAPSVALQVIGVILVVSIVFSAFGIFSLFRAN